MNLRVLTQTFFKRLQLFLLDLLNDLRTNLLQRRRRHSAYVVDAENKAIDLGDDPAFVPDTAAELLDPRMGAR